MSDSSTRSEIPGTASDVAVRREPGVAGLGTDAERRLEAHICRILDRLSGRGRFGEVAIRVVSDATMRSLHARHCGDPSTTDVLTFPSARDGLIDVDIAVCVDEAARSAATRGHPVEREILLYIVHGLLHCVGYDDHDPASFAAMHAEEDRLLEAIGVGATFGHLGTPASPALRVPSGHPLPRAGEGRAEGCP